jgi:hypothetical protein
VTAAENPRAFLEAVINAEDASLKERLDAMRQLQDLGLAAACGCFVREAEELDEREVAFLEAELGGEVDARLAEAAAEIETGSRGYPRAAAAIRRLVRAEVEARSAGESGEVVRLRAEVAALREQLKDKPKRRTGRRTAEPRDCVPPPAEPEPPAEAAETVLTAELLERQWPRQRSAIRRWAG